MVDNSRTEFSGATQETLSKKPIKILVIGDNPLFLEGTVRVIKMGGDFEVQSTTNSVEGLEIMKKAKATGNSIGIVVYDLEGSGSDVAEKAKGLARHFILRSETIREPQTMTLRESKLTGVDERLPKNGPIAEFIRHIKAAEEKIISEDEIKKEAEKKDLLRILIAEDSKDSDVLKEMVDEYTTGFEVRNLTGSVSEALKMLRDAKEQGKPIDVIISDLGLTDDKEGGFKIAEAVLNEGLAKYFILFTGRAVEIGAKYNKEQLKEKGIDLLIGKPLTKATLQESLNSAKETISKPSSAK